MSLGVDASKEHIGQRLQESILHTLSMRALLCHEHSALVTSPSGDVMSPSGDPLFWRAPSGECVFCVA